MPDLSFLGALSPAAQLAAVCAACVVVVTSLLLFRRPLGQYIAARLGGDAAAAALPPVLPASQMDIPMPACAPVPACGLTPGITDDHRWAVLNEIEGGSPYAVVAFGYDLSLRVINDEAMDLLGYHYHQLIDHSVILLLADDDEDSFRVWLERYLREHKAGDVPKLQKTPKPLRLKRSDGVLLPVIAYWTHFGNGHGGLRAVLVPAV